MKFNENTVIIGTKAVLVPYLPEHVPKYHYWMHDEELQRLTASEPLSLEEEYEMQQKWRLDEDKLTFIVLARGESQLPFEISETLSPADAWIKALPMVGDVNMFLKGVLPTQSRKDEAQDSQDFEAELEIMIAEPAYRRKGIALEALQLVLEYATGIPRSSFGPNSSFSPQILGLTTQDYKGLEIPPQALVARIGDTNLPSIRLFSLLGFRVVRRVEVFEEVEMRLLEPSGVGGGASNVDS